MGSLRAGQAPTRNDAILIMLKTSTLPKNNHILSNAVIGTMVGLVLAGLLIWGTITLLTPYQFHGMTLQSTEPAKNFTLTNPMGQRVALTDFRGQFVMLYFGYTTCPDVCPTTLAELHKARKLLGRNGDQLQVIMITVDPERDTPALLADYVTHFDSSFMALTGTSDEIARAASMYGVFFERAKEESALGYLVNHTATVMLVDRGGSLREIFPFGAKAEDIASDLQYLMQR